MQMGAVDDNGKAWKSTGFAPDPTIQSIRVTLQCDDAFRLLLPIMLARMT